MRDASPPIDEKYCQCSRIFDAKDFARRFPWVVESSVLAMVLIGLVANTTAMICLFAGVLEISHLF